MVVPILDFSLYNILEFQKYNTNSCTWITTYHCSNKLRSNLLNIKINAELFVKNSQLILEINGITQREIQDIYK